MGFILIVVNDKWVLEYKGNYYKFTDVDGHNSIVSETAFSLKEAQNNCCEHDGVYLLSLGETEILNCWREDIVKYYLWSKIMMFCGWC